MYATGRSVLKDDAEAAKWFRLAAEQGVASAQYDLGLSYAFGEGVLKDAAEAARWFRLAALKYPIPWCLRKANGRAEQAGKRTSLRSRSRLST